MITESGEADLLETLRVIAAIAEGSMTPNSLPHIAKLARLAIVAMLEPKVEVITRRDESIFTPDQMRAFAKGIDIHDLIVSTVERHMARGGFDRTLRGRTPPTNHGR